MIRYILFYNSIHRSNFFNKILLYRINCTIYIYVNHFKLDAIIVQEEITYINGETVKAIAIACATEHMARGKMDSF